MALTWGSSDLGASPSAAAAAAILSLCDRVLGEIGRRSHLFSWLRAPGSGPEEWLSVDAYYPVNRLVVVCQEPSPYAQLYAELVPAHGLRLLALAPSELSEDPTQAEPELRRRIAELNLPPRPAPPAYPADDEAAHDSPVARVAASLAQATSPAVFDQRPSAARTAATERGARFVATRNARERPAARIPPAAHAPRAARREPAPLRRLAPASGARLEAAARARARKRSREGPQNAAVGLLLGIVLAAALSAELYFGIGQVALSGGHVVLAFGLAMDAIARTLGTVAASRAGEPGWAWACALGGSLAVAPFALFGPDGPVSTDPAPMAGVVSVLAALLIALALMGSALHL
jgi:hypothetical protein